MIDHLPDGWHEDVPMDDYIADPALSSSGSVKIDQTPKTFEHDRSHQREETKAMIEGTALHHAVLEPDTFDGYYVVLGLCEASKKDGDPCTNPGTVYRDGQCFCGVRGHDPYGKDVPMADGIHVFAEDAMDRLNLAQKSVLEHDVAGKYFHGQGRSEVTGIWTDAATGVRCKIRLDREIARASHHVDLKYTGDITDEGFKRQAGRMGWVQRSAYYRRGMEALGRPADASVILAVENVAPHDCRAFLLDEDQVALFGRRIDGTLETYAQCHAANVWPGYPQVLTPLSLAKWHLPYEAPTDDFGGETP